MDIGTVYTTVWLILAVGILADLTSTRPALGERIFFAFAMIAWPFFLPIFLYNIYRNRDKSEK
jgi:hypothetical protein